MPLSTGAGRAALAASIHSLRPLAFQRTSCRRAPDAVETRVKQLAVRPEYQVETIARADFADVDLGRQRREILRGDLRRSPGRAQRPVEPVANASANAQRSVERHRRRLRGGVGFELHRALRHEIDRLDGLGRRHRHAGRAAARQRRNAKRLPLLLLVGRQVGRSREATPRQQCCTAARARPRSSSPARGQRRRASALRSGCAWLRDVNTAPVMPIKVKTGLNLVARNLAFARRAAMFVIMARRSDAPRPGHPRADQHGQDLPRDRADVRPFARASSAFRCGCSPARSTTASSR